MTEMNVVARVYAPAVEAFLADEQGTSALVLSELSGRDAHEEITRFVMEDYARSLVNLAAAVRFYGYPLDVRIFPTKLDDRRSVESKRITDLPA